MGADRNEPVGGRAPARQFLIFGVPIGLGLASARLAGDAATRSGASGPAALLASVGAAAVVAASAATVLVWLERRRR